MLVSDRQLRLVFDEVCEGVLVESRDRVVYLNRAYAGLLGYPSTTELASATIADIAHPEDLERLQWFGRCRRAGKTAPARYTFRACGRKGRIVTFDASISMARVDGEMMIATVARKIECERPLLFDSRLSAREEEVIRYLIAGRRSKEIAAILCVSDKTIGTHRFRAFQKLGLRGELDLFRLAAERGWINEVTASLPSR